MFTKINEKKATTKLTPRNVRQQRAYMMCTDLLHSPITSMKRSLSFWWSNSPQIENFCFNFEITVAIFIAVRYIFPLLFEHPKGRSGDVVCQLFTGEAFVWVGALASTFSLVCIALERYLAIKFPYDERKRVTNAKLKYVVVLGWVFAASWNLPLFLYARYDPVSEFCLFQWPTASFPKVHSLLCALLYGVLPISIMSYLYSKLVYKLWFRPLVTSTMVQQSKLRYTRKSARLVVTVSVVYAICWIPNLAVYVISSFSTQQLYSAVHTTSIVLVTFNSAINPVLYSWQSDRLRRHMLALLPFGCSTRQCRVPPAIMSRRNPSRKASRPTQIPSLVSRGPVAWKLPQNETQDAKIEDYLFV